MKFSKGDKVRITRGSHAGESASYVDDYTAASVIPGMFPTVNVTLADGSTETVDADAIEPAPKRRKK